MPRGATKKSNKPEIEILPVPEGVVAVDDWGAVYGYKYNDEGEAISILDHWEIPEEDRILKAMDKTITIDFHKFFHIPESNFN